MNENRKKELYEQTLIKIEQDETIPRAKDAFSHVDDANLDFKSFILGWSTHEAMDTLNCLLHEDKMSDEEYGQMEDLPFLIAVTIAECAAKEMGYGFIFRA